MKNIIILSGDVNYIEKVKKFREVSRYKIQVVSDEMALMEQLRLVKTDIFMLDMAAVSEIKKIMLAVKHNHPKVVRMLVHENAKITDAFDVGEKLNSKFVCNKSMPLEHVWETIDKIMDLTDKVNDPELIELMARLDHLPTVPNIYHELTALIENNAPMDGIAKAIENDPAVAANILKLANTAFYNAKTGSIRQAMMYIGLINVKNIILTTAVFGNDGLDPESRTKHWEHVRLTNQILSALYNDLLGKKLDNNLSAVGLLHDIGSIVLMSNFPKAYDTAIKSVQRDPNKSFREVEKVLIGFNHELVGGYLMDLWGLPFPLIEVALKHHDPLDQSVINKELVAAVHLANYAAWHLLDYVAYVIPVDTRVYEVLKINPEQFHLFLEKFKIKQGL